MIHTSKQLKDKVRNISKGDNDIANTLIRNFMMERFLERVSISDYSNNFILKGGMLVASIVGVDMRATMDIDTTVNALPLNENDIQKIISEICSIPVEDGVCFHIISSKSIMTDFEYPGVRLMLEAVLKPMRQIIKVDISTDDIITPEAIEFEYRLMFEDRTILLLSYNKETLLAEKVQTILARGTANTRIRDFYDVYSIMKMHAVDVDKELFLKAFHATCKKRESLFTNKDIEEVLAQIEGNNGMTQMWERYRKKNYFVGSLNWEYVLMDVLQMIRTYIINESANESLKYQTVQISEEQIHSGLTKDARTALEEQSKKYCLQ